MSESGKAVFLSYASQDADAARRICEALRQAGLEVWFDQSELRGGDAWDAQIRKRIKECALFVPVISAHTQARAEGYFRLEWKLAVDRSHLMADDAAFLFPVVIDDVPDATARVPDKFRDVQWTRLRLDETPTELAARVAKLLSGAAGEAARSRPAERGGGATSPAKPAWLRYGWSVVGIVFGLIYAIRPFFLPERSHEEKPPAAVAPATPPAPAVAPSAAEKMAAPSADARQLVAKARALFENPNYTLDDLRLAEDLCKQATTRDPNDSEVWAAYGELSSEMIGGGVDASPERRELARTQVERAVKLAPDSDEARFAKASYLRRQGGAAKNEAEALFRDLLQRQPEAPRLLIGLGKTIWGNVGGGRLRAPERVDEALALFARAAAVPAGRAEGLRERAFLLMILGRAAEAEAAVTESLAVQPTRSATMMQVQLALNAGDLARSGTALSRLSPDALRWDYGALVAVSHWLFAHEPGRALQVLEGIPRDYLSSNMGEGPTDYWRGVAYQMDGREQAARSAWANALKIAERRLGEQPRNVNLGGMHALLLALLGESEQARAALQLVDEIAPDGSRFSIKAHVLLDPVGPSLGRLERMQRQSSILGFRSWLRYDPDFDLLRQEPRFQALLGEAPAQSPASGLPSPSHPPEADMKSVAVLAFANLSDDKDNEYFSDGISEELLNVLAKVKQLKVAARTSSFSFKGQNVPVPDIASKLGVAYVVEGSVRKAGNKVRITAQLIKAADGFHVWSETFDRELKDIFAVQDEIAKNVLEAVKGSLIGGEQAPQTATTKIEAYTLYLQGQGELAKRGEVGLREAIRLFEAVLAIDPDYVPALVGLAKARVVLPNYSGLIGQPARDTVARAEAAAQHALELEPRNAEAYMVLGWAHALAEWHWSQGEAELLKAKELAPNNPWVANFIGDYYRFVLNNPASVAAKRQALELDPLSRVSYWDVGYAYVVTGDYDEAIRFGARAIELAPHNLDSYLPGILAASRSGRVDLMRQMVGAARQNVHEEEGYLLLYEILLAVVGKNPPEARRLLAQAEPLAETGKASPAYIGYCHLLLGDSAEALRWLRRGYEARDQMLVWSENIDFDVIAANPVTRPLLDEPGLKELYELRQRNVRAGLNKL